MAPYLLNLRVDMIDGLGSAASVPKLKGYWIQLFSASALEKDNGRTHEIGA
jgi:hypothetical protein